MSLSRFTAAAISAAGRIAVLGAVAALTLSTVPASAEAPALDLSKYRGKVVYVDFWASWCGPCKQSFPYMKVLAAKYPANDFVVLTINVDRQRAAADGFLKQVGGGLPVVYDSQGSIAKTYKVADMPTSFLVDRDGKVRFRHQGFFPAKKAEYEAHIAQLIKERS